MSKHAGSRHSGIAPSTFDRRIARPDLMTLRELKDFAQVVDSDPRELATEILDDLAA